MRIPVVGGSQFAAHPAYDALGVRCFIRGASRVYQFPQQFRWFPW
jgi:hypothetical protein